MATPTIRAESSKNEEPDDPYRISSSEETRYMALFQKLDTENGYLSARRAVLVFRKSGLPQETLSKIWALSDQDADGRLSVQEFCAAMHLVCCVRTRGLPLPEPAVRISSKKTKMPKRTEAGNPRPKATKKKETKSPQRRARMASLVGHDQSGSGPQDSAAHRRDVTQQQVSDRNEDYADREYASHVVTPPTVAGPGIRHVDQPQDPGLEGSSSAGEDRGPAYMYDVKPDGSKPEPGDLTMPRTTREIFQEGQLRSVGTHKTEHNFPMHDSAGVKERQVAETKMIKTSTDTTGGVRYQRGPPTKRRLHLRQLNASDVNAVFAEGQRAINSLRDVQSSSVFVMGLDRLSAKDMARRVPVNEPPRRRHTLPQAAEGRLRCTEEMLPGRGRRTSLLVTAYEPAAVFLKKRAGKMRTREVALAQATATAAIKWKLKPLSENTESTGTAGGEKNDPTRGDLNVAGLPLLDEDVDIIVHLLRQNHAFNRLDLRRCFLSDKHFVSLSQALAWNCCIEQLCLKECVLTDVSAAAIADVLTVNKHIYSIDIRGCQGLQEKALREILTAADDNSSLSIINGMELAVLQAAGSDTLDLSGWRLGYVEAVVVAHCLCKREDGLQRIDLHDNLITTEAFATLMPALRMQTHLRSLDLSHNQVDERILLEVEDLLNRNPRLSKVNLTGNRISCTEFEPYGIRVMKLLSLNNTVTVFEMEDNDVSPKMLTIIAEKLAANRAVRKDMTFVDCLRLKYPRVTPQPVLADPRKLHLNDADVHFMVQEGIPAMQTTVHTEREVTSILGGVKLLGMPTDLFVVRKRDINETLL